MISCLILKVLDLIQFSADIGPLVKIVGKMLGDFLNFFILYAILVIMFAIVGNLNFIFYLSEFTGLFESCETVLDASVGNYNFEMFKVIKNNDFMTVFGDFYTIAIVVTFNILILNLIIAILSNTYNQFDTKSTGLYLSKILNARDEMTFDDHYGAILLSMTPLNVAVMPFVPYALFKKPHPILNQLMMIIQWAVFILIIYAIFFIGSLLMLPFAYLKSLSVKAQLIFKGQNLRESVLNKLYFVGFMAFGFPSLIFSLGADMVYFWRNNFRSNLKKIIIERQRSTLTNDTIRELKMLCSKYSDQKIKSVYSIDLVKTFRKNFQVKENLQYLLFGQMIPEEGFGNNSALAGGHENRIVSLKTANLRAHTQQKKQQENIQMQVTQSKYEIEQYNNVKSILMNFSFENAGQKTLCIEIIENVMDELRRERKIAMVLADSDIEEYIKLDLSNLEDDSDMTDFKKRVLSDKSKFRSDLAQKVSILRLGYMFKMLKAVHPGKASMLGAEAFKLKVMKIEQRDSKKKKYDYGVGSQSMMSGGEGFASMQSSNMDEAMMKNESKSMNIVDPLLKNINEFVGVVKQEIIDIGTKKLNEIEKLYKEFKDSGGLDNLDTVEENLKQIEEGRKPQQSTQM